MSEDDHVSLPNSFPLPKHHQRSVEYALERWVMPIKERRMFLSNITSAMLRYKRYPSREDYGTVACAVIIAYPSLKGTSGRPYASCLLSVLEYQANMHSYN